MLEQHTMLASFVAEHIFGEYRDFHILQQDEDIYVRTFNQEKGWYGSTIFFERANLPYVVQAMEDYFDPQRRGERTYISVERGKDDFLVSTAMPTKADYAISLINNRTATVDGLTSKSWDMIMEPMTALRLKDELKKLL